MFAWLRRLLHHRRVESQMDDELRFHMELLRDDLIQRGISPALRQY